MSTIAKFLAQPPDNFSTQIASSTLAANGLTCQLDSASGLPTEGVGQFFKKDANGDLVAGSVEFCHWTNVAGNTISFSDTGDRGITGSDSGAQAYVADDYFEVWSSSYYTAYGGLINHASTGHLKSGAEIDDTSADHQYILGVSELAADRTITLPLLTGNDDFVFEDHTQTLTNKTLTSPTINTATIASPVLSGAGATAAGTLGYGAADHNLLVGDGAANNPIHIGHWKAWTPTLSNLFTDAKWTKACSYVQIGKTVHFKMKLLASDTTPMAGSNAATFTLPVTSVDYTLTDVFQVIGTGGILDAGAGIFSCKVIWTATTTAAINYENASGASLALGDLTASVPMTWTTNDGIWVMGTYEAA